MHVSKDLRRTLDELGQNFLQEFLEVEVSRNANNVEALAELGQIYTTRGRWSQGLRVDQKLVHLVPTSPTVHYNLACSYALLGATEEALDCLERAADLGYEDYRFMAADEDLAAVRGELRFGELLERIRTEQKQF